MPNSKISRRTTETQASRKWLPPRGVLGELVAAAAVAAAALRARRSELERKAGSAPRPRSFVGRLKGETVGIIAEVKRASPSRGSINPGLDVAAQCRAYESGGAAAISILTESSRFAGSIADLTAAAEACSVPLLRKDFIVDELQVLEARAAGASAVLLIARALEPSRLMELFQAALEAKLYALVEVRDEDELDRALSIGATLIGVNNRDLETLKVDEAALRLIPSIPRNCVAVAESGYQTATEITRVAEAGADAVLVGSELSRITNPAESVRKLSAVKRAPHARPN